MVDAVSPAVVAVFVAVAVLAYVTPGPDWFVVLPRAASSRRAGVVAALGVQSGLVVHMTAAAVGVAGLLLASAEAFMVLKLIGAGYLIYLGVRALIRARRAAAPAAGGGLDLPEQAAGLAVVYRQAFLANVLNPKAALFFVAVLPQFLDPSRPVASQVLLLGVIDIALGLVWWVVFVGAVGRLRTWLSRPRGQVAVETVSGVALTGLGVALAVAKPG